MTDVEFGVVLPQLGGTWDDVVRFARRTEEAGFDSVWVVDHLLGFPPEEGILEAWTVMAALAGATSRIGLGAQVLCQSFRSPALLAKMATTLDLISGGRLRFLVGAGWFEPEYRAFGFPFPEPAQRVDELEDTLRICRGMFDSGATPFTHQGVHHHVREVVNVPPPSRSIPIGVGAVGDRMLDVVARLGDEWNVPAMVLGSYDERRRRLEASLDRAGRDVRRSAQIVFAPGEREVAPWLSMFNFYGFVSDERALGEVAEALPELRAAH